MKMKKLILLFAVTLAMGFTACSNDDIPVIDIQPEDVIGKWYAEYDQPGSFDANGVAVEYQKIAQYASFQENGNGFWSILFLDAAGKAIDIPGYSCGGTIKYTINDNTINVNMESGKMPILEDNWDVKYSKSLLTVKASSLSEPMAPITPEQEEMVKKWLKQLDLAEVDPNFYVYLCFGQSNMEGNAQWETIDNQKVDARFQMLATTNFDSPKRKLGEWYTAKCPIVSPMGKLGPTDYFGRTMVAALPTNVKVGVVAVAMGGSPIEMFDKDKYAAKLKANPNEWWATLSKNYYGGNPYGRLIEMAKKAQKVGVIKGILLHQGCSNCGDPNWPKMVKKIYNDMLTDLSLEAENVPLLVGEVEYADQGGGCSSHNNVVAKIPSTIPTGHVVSASGIPGNGSDPWHFSAAGYRTLGKRYAYVMLQTMGLETKVNPDYEMPENLKKILTPKTFETTITGKAKTSVTLKLMCTFVDGHKEDLTTETTFSSDDFTITKGKVNLGEDGPSGIVKAVYTDFFGTTHNIEISVKTPGASGGQDTPDTPGYGQLTSLADIENHDFYILNEDAGKMFYGSDNQNLGFDEPSKVLDNTGIVGYMFRAEKLSGTNYYLLRLLQLNGSEYSIWGSPGYLNSQPADKWCSFILGLNNQNGQDMKNGAVWEIKYEDNLGFTMKNIGTGLFLSDNAPAKYEDPTYFTFYAEGVK